MTSLIRHEDGRSGMPALFGWAPLRRFDGLFRWEPYSGAPNITDTGDEVTLSVDLPGVDARDVDITLHAGTLTVIGTRGEWTYRYAITVGNAIDPDRIDATLDKGVLTVRAARREAAKPRRIALASAPGHTRDERRRKKPLFSRFRVNHRK
jgi:HSP20 family molecular chaperone IbpA